MVGKDIDIARDRARDARLEDLTDFTRLLRSALAV
eukprot:CAMPEP_0117758112 /NCGR_PEP_ID=MMETSP0947-20121206/15173_1 /TAXON_ID=44440 /ORGANISM="Chattonella subsalsa, Strain CCMP2191" /LENGTH=34 /DNA_ID= /DNA_START= /DNA_END= /DNA_ORIENTATION=